MTTTISPVKKLTIASARAQLRPLGISLAKGLEDYTVRVIGSAPGNGYHTTDLADALASGLAMAAERDAKTAPAAPISRTKVDEEQDVETLTIDLKGLTTLEVRELKRLLAFRAGICADCRDADGEVTYRQAFDDVVDALERRSWIEKAKFELQKRGAGIVESDAMARSLADNYYPDTSAAAAVEDVA
jgi:hypothetical protein